MVAPLVVLGYAFNLDQWDGYAADRRNLLDHIMANQVENVVVLTGDIHTSWGNDIPHPDSSYNSSTGAGSVAVEFVSPSITSPNTPFPIPQSFIQLANPHIKYADLTMHGFTILDINKTRTQCDWNFVPSINPAVYSDAWDDGWYVNLGERWLEHASSAVAPPATFQPYAPLSVNNPPLASLTNGIKTVPKEIVILGLRPNPFKEKIVVEYYQFHSGAAEIEVYDAAGQKIFSVQTPGLPAGYHLAEIDPGETSGAGRMIVVLRKNGEFSARQAIKIK